MPRATSAGDAATNVTTSAAVVVSGALSRRSLLLQNIGSTDIWLRFGSAPTTTASSEVGFKLTAGQTISYTLEEVPSEDLYAATATGSSRVFATWTN